MLDVLESERYGNPARGAHSYSIRAYQLIEMARDTLKSFFHTGDLYEIIFSGSVTIALNAVLKGFIQAGDHVSIYMVSISLVFAIGLGVPLGILLAETRKQGVLANSLMYTVLQTLINILRSVPFIILLVAILPFTRLVVGTSIGTTAAIVPLTLYIVPFMGRLIEQAILEIPLTIIECAKILGANRLEIILYFILPEARPAIILAITNSMIGLINASSMAGTVGGGGIGDLAISQGYQRFNSVMIVVTVVILIVLINSIQFLGNYLYHKIKY
ncbi:aminotransferase class V-fold PLP-dependent enzyme [Enterococcus hirae]|nr:aminotransferase class V-fold PLP-dependent enzyme [Enterococcus hirae]EMF0192037.1 aminotransferase class V-fold PLP-dependent enzyme [Enterococcus hirae]EMF0241018.1 aminotransferase class V-fold PLP-dependent enzyme [Enterococcus hirae]EMF0245629.1 aminotransferase class V-fold PLP-dependent enzyme [Enterococcus hirae]